MNNKCIVLLSGGQDSTTCLYWAKKNFEEVIAISFDYGQKHRIELRQAKKISIDAGCDHYTIDVDGLLGGSSLTDGPVTNHNMSHPQNASLPASFTAGRNMLFLTIVASWGYNRGIHNIVTGVCQTDYSGYPDCRREFIDSMENTLTLAMSTKKVMYNWEVPTPKISYPLFRIHTPLMYLTKAETWKLAKELGVAYECARSENKNSMENDTQVSVLEVIIQDTMTDYNGDTAMNEWGMGTNNNPATDLRVKGFYEAKEKGWI